MAFLSLLGLLTPSFATQSTLVGITAGEDPPRTPKLFSSIPWLFSSIPWLIGEGVIRERRVSLGLFLDVTGPLGRDGNFATKTQTAMCPRFSSLGTGG